MRAKTRFAMVTPTKGAIIRKKIIHTAGLCVAAFYILNLVAVVISMLILLTGCFNTTNPLVESYDKFLNTVGTEYVEYVKADSKLTDTEKKARELNVICARALVDEAKK